MELFYVLLEKEVTQVDTIVKTHGTMCLKSLHFNYMQIIPKLLQKILTMEENAGIIMRLNLFILQMREL